MSNKPGGLLFVFGQCEPAVSIQDFNDWYDGEHAPARLTVPGITSAVRYKSTDEQKPDWLAIYDLASPETLKSDAYLALRDKASDNEKAIVPRLPVLQRRAYSLINEVVKPDLPPDTLPGKHLLVVLWSVPKELDAELHEWYDKEHTSDIAKVPGWLRARRYKLVDGTDIAGKGPSMEGFDYLVLHEWDRDGYLKAPEFIEACKTPWSVKVIGGANACIFREFILYKNFEKQV
ncbi:hypothetical protein AN958_10900 [Leucoagaricus sp. SymC.cos]|nr:hypothetical protein AN958_10900 [Leucoagaricus sp. SymC.cos]